MKNAAALAALSLALAACAMPSLPTLPSATPLPGEVRVKKVDRLSFQDQPEPNLFRIEFDAARSKAMRERAALEVHGDRSDPYWALMQYLEVVAEQELRSKSLCAGTAKAVSAVDGIDGSGPMSAVFACRPPVF